MSRELWVDGINMPEVYSVGSYQDRAVDVRFVFNGACDCGDSLQTITTEVPDHGRYRIAYIAWCMDCQKPCASVVTDEEVYLRRTVIKRKEAPDAS